MDAQRLVRGPISHGLEPSSQDKVAHMQTTRHGSGHSSRESLGEWTSYLIKQKIVSFL